MQKRRIAVDGRQFAAADRRRTTVTFQIQLVLIRCIQVSADGNVIAVHRPIGHFGTAIQEGLIRLRLMAGRWWRRWTNECSARQLHIAAQRGLRIWTDAIHCIEIQHLGSLLSVETQCSAFTCWIFTFQRQQSHDGNKFTKIAIIVRGQVEPLPAKI